MKARMLVDLNEKVKKGDSVPVGQEKRLVRVGLAEEVNDEDGGLTVAGYVDSYIAGDWRDGAPADVEQFAANHASEIEAEFQRRAAPQASPRKGARAKTKSAK